ncbi:MAG: SAM-dependent chlorinase/fluorinase [Cyanobacteria bacterium J06638_20]
MPSGRPLLTLLTDFGLQDAYVGVMKGVIAGINPEVNMVDLTHQIPPQDIAAARFNLLNSAPYFPQGTVHVVVVDPGVGGRRRAIALQTPRHFFVGPDNGVFSGLVSQEPLLSAVELTNSQHWRTPEPSTTFHGRDIFAAVGAHLTLGVALEDLGTAIAFDSLVQLPLPACQSKDNVLHGCIQYIDHFGNLITNIPADRLPTTWHLTIDDLTLPKRTTYAAVSSGELVALTGSHGWVEVAVNGGNAGDRLQAKLGDAVQVQLL